MSYSFETELSKFKETNLNSEENISDDELEKIYGGKVSTLALGKKGGSRRRRRNLWKFFFHRS